MNLLEKNIPYHDGMKTIWADIQKMSGQFDGAYMREKHIYMVSVIFEEKLKDFYEKFGFYTMLSGQLETYESR